MKQNDEKNLPLEKRVSDALDSSIEDLHPDIRRKLNQARITALQRQSNPTIFSNLAFFSNLASFSNQFWKTAGAVSFVALIAFVSLNLSNNQVVPNNDIASNDGMINENSLKQITIENGGLEEVELIEQLEFALWMAEEDQIASL